MGMATRDVHREIRWLENAISETRKRIGWNAEHRWHEVANGDWVDVTDERNAALEVEIRKCEIMLEHNRSKL